ncbi:MAG: lipoprotein signal peptidase [Gammaproteobacteria bacterium]|nr:lipoprotein signal peptidase [Gammaproteobacteria bacterium]
MEKLYKLLWVVLSALIIAFDQYTKYLVMQKINFLSGIKITGFFNLINMHNTGAAFSFLAAESGWQNLFFIILAMVATVFLLGWLWRLKKNQKLTSLAISLILAGAIGNLIDRLFRGFVVDFLDFHWHMYHWPAFNVADGAITIGALLLLLSFVKENR